MKSYLIRIVLLLCVVFGSGCASRGRAFWERVEPGSTQRGPRLVYMEGWYQVPSSALPESPVRRSETYYQSFSGRNTYYHSQGTENSVGVYTNPYTGSPSVQIEQRTYSTTTRTISPQFPY